MTTDRDLLATQTIDTLRSLYPSIPSRINGKTPRKADIVDLAWSWECVLQSGLAEVIATMAGRPTARIVRPAADSGIRCGNCGERHADSAAVRACFGVTKAAPAPRPEPSGRIRCGHCRGRHDHAADVRACWRRYGKVAGSAVRSAA